MRAHLGTYPAGFYYSDIQSRNETTKSRTHINYVSPSADNGPAMAGPAGPVPALMLVMVHNVVPKNHETLLIANIF